MIRTIAYGPEGNPNFPGTPAYNQAHGVGNRIIDPKTGNYMSASASAAYKGSGATTSTSPFSGVAMSPVTAKDITSPFQQAIDSLTGATGDVEKMYQQGKRRTLSDIAMQSVNAGMGNTLNLPSAGIAYDEANRAATNTAVAGQKAGVLTDLGQTLAGMYGVNVGSQTSLANAQLDASTAIANAQTGAGASASNAAMSYAADQERNALQRYIADLEMKYKYGAGAKSSPMSMADLFG